MRAALLALLATPAMPCTHDAMLVLDGSGSMAEIGYDTGAATRIEDARAALRRAMPQVEPFRRIGLIAYGPGGAGSCDGITLHFPPVEASAAPAIAAAEGLDPGGLTPLSRSVERAAALLSHRTEPATVVLVTDGNETCGGTPCALGARLAAEAADLTIHVIGFKATRDFFSWDNPDQQIYAGDTVAKCLSDRTGGLFVDADTVDELVAALNATLGCVIGAIPLPLGRGMG
ncbi:VWA domain-containing protein [Jannaschia sp. Os4]|uniref:vWA domain-containing protein n=1 Tax=Jannaschia sp. Os4 TaxID=2807617 RepID=UPI0031B5F724